MAPEEAPGEVPARKKPASNYLRSSKILANYVYSGRLGNGDEESGDGWNFRGSGPMQLPEETTSQPSRPHPAFRCWHTRIWSGTTARRRRVGVLLLVPQHLGQVDRGRDAPGQWPGTSRTDDRRRRYEAAQRALA